MFGKKRSFRKYAATFSLGAVAGAALALLYAPMKGKKLQQKIGEATGNVIEGVQESARRLSKA